MAFAGFETATRTRREPESVTRSGNDLSPLVRVCTKTGRPPFAVAKGIPPPESVEQAASEERRYILGLIALMIATTVMPALAMLVYIIFNPDAFMYDIAP